MAHKKFIPTAEDGRDMSEELQAFATFIGLESSAAKRYSILLVLELFAGLKSGHLNPAKVVCEIDALEGKGLPSQLKPPVLFKHPPLQGLWHKHYLEDGLRAVAINVQKGMVKFGIPAFQQQVNEALAAGEERYVSEGDCKSIADDIVQGNWLRLSSSSALTGEWIVYAEHQGKNYYLCLGKHDSGDDKIREQIDAICVHEFPFLTSLLPGI